MLKTQLKQKINGLKLRVRIQRYTAVDFQGWSEMTLKIKIAYISIFKSVCVCGGGGGGGGLHSTSAFYCVKLHMN